MCRLSSTDIVSAIELQARSYALLQWLEFSLRHGSIAPEVVLDHGNRQSGALEWLEQNDGMLPRDVRGDGGDLHRLAGFFTTYYEGTFEFHATPGERLFSEDAHCFCPMCSFMVQKPHLRARRLTKGDRSSANDMMERHLSSLAEDCERPLKGTTLQDLLADRTFREDLALLAYIADIEERAKGRVKGAAPLALWRTFAWTETGSPIKGWKLTTERVLAAQDRVIFRLPPADGL